MIFVTLWETKITKLKTISYSNCLAQLDFFISMGVSEFFLLSPMSYITELSASLMLWSFSTVPHIVVEHKNFPTITLLLLLYNCNYVTCRNHYYLILRICNSCEKALPLPKGSQPTG